MGEVPLRRGFVFALRMLMAWIFLYAASHQVLNSKFSVVGLLSHAKTFHDLFASLTDPAVAPAVAFLVAYGHLLIGLSLLLGLLVRVSACFGIALLVLYWMARMDFPYIDSVNDFIVDPHIVYSAVLALLISVRAGHVWGLDGWAAKQPIATRHAAVRLAVG
jgi:thiosulfate dehydrogenase [quinone] large subunit